MTKDDLLAFLKSDLGVDTSKLEDETALLSSGLVDSFSMIDLIQFVERASSAKVAPTDVSMDNLDTVKRILDFVARISAR
jgi:acyl carrier protein